MELCENNLFIQTHCNKKKQYILDKLENGVKLFETLIPNEEPDDVFIEYVIFDIADDNLINLLFFTKVPCIEFCKRLAGLYNVNIQLTYYNEIKNYSPDIKLISDKK
jgi:hypothetical protein